MPGNSQRRGAIRTGNSKKGAIVGSGGQRRKALEGKGPTPRAEDRPNHKAYKARKAAATSASGRTPRAGAAGNRVNARKRGGSDEVIMGRNAVLEALRESVPITTVWISGKVDDLRIREAVNIATEKGIPVLEAPRAEMDRLTDSTVHQGLAAKMKPYKYADVSDILDTSDAFARVSTRPLVVALDSITDTRNLGAIIRSAAAFGANGIILPERRSATMTAAAWKTSAGAVDAVLGHHDVDAFAGEHLQPGVVAHEVLGALRPHPGGRDDIGSLDEVLLARLQIGEAGAVDPSRVIGLEPHHLRAAGGERPESRGGAHEVDDQAGVVHPGVVEADRAGERLVLDAGEQLERARLAVVLLRGDGAVPAAADLGEHVVHAHPHGAVAAFDDGGAQRP